MLDFIELWCGNQRQRDLEFRPAGWTIHGTDFAPVQEHDRTTDGQSQADAADVALFLAAFKLFEQRLRVAGAETGTVVLDVELVG